MFKRILAVLRARAREFYRDKTGLSWNLVMPMVILLGFAFIFAEGPQDVLKIGVISDRPLAELDAPFVQSPGIRFVRITDQAKARVRVQRHDLDLLYRPVTGEYWVNTESPKSQLAEQLLKSDGSTATNLRRQEQSGAGLRYVDWVMPGVLGMNIMFSCLWGVGWVIVRYRKNGVLRRLQATPLTAFEFLSAQIIARLAIVLIVTSTIYVGAALLVDFVMRGNALLLLFVYLLGGACLTSMGLLVAARLATEEVADGILNLLSWPMLILSGVWFSLEDATTLARGIAQVFPLTHIVDAARKIMLDGAGLLDIAPQLGLLVGLTLLFLTISARMFRWS